MSSSSWASYHGGGGAQLDFTPTPADDDYFQKSEAFWAFVRSRPELDAMKAEPEARPAPPALSVAVVTREKHACLENLAEITRKGVTAAAFASRLPTCRCRARGAGSAASLEVDAAAIAPDLDAWDTCHPSERVPFSRTPAAPRLRSTAPRPPAAADRSPTVACALCCQDA